MLPCNICNKIYKSVPALREHFKTNTHKEKVVSSKITSFQNSSIKDITAQQAHFTIDNDSSTQLLGTDKGELSLTVLEVPPILLPPRVCLEFNANGTDSYQLIEEHHPKNQVANNVNDITTGLKDNVIGIRDLQDISHDIKLSTNPVSHEPIDIMSDSKLVDNINSPPNVYKCIACRKEYTQKNNLYRHYKTCTIYTEAKKLNKTTTTTMENAIHLIKQKYFKKIIPAIISNINNTDSQTQYKSVSNNQIEQNITNNITINNNITIGTWKTINYVRPFLHENLDVLDDEKNIEAIVASGYNAVNTLIDIVYSQPENNNIQIINRRKNFVRTIDANGEIIIIRFNEACEKLAYKFLNKTDELMDKNSAKIIAKNPGFAKGVLVYEQSNNWFGESGNERYADYESHIGMKIENISRKSDINLIRFQNETKNLLLSGGTLNFNKDSL